MKSPFLPPMSRFLLLPLLLTAGCVVFEPVGHFFAQGYRNTVTYFNAYYNASRLFDDAEQEIITAQRTSQRAGMQTGPRTASGTAIATIPASARQKLVSVIDKCSNILAFHAESDLVDDALMLIGRSYEYQGEFVKAERKYTELLSQYPGGDLAPQAQAHLGSVLLEQHRLPEAATALDEAAATARQTEDDGLLAFVLHRQAQLAREQGDVQNALRIYGELHRLEGDDPAAPNALLEQGEILLDDKKPADAMTLMGAMEDISDDPYDIFQARMLAVRALEDLGRNDEALRRLEDLQNEIRFRDRLAFIRLERARVLAAEGRFDEATTEYTVVDTSYVRQAPGVTAGYELAVLLEKRRHDLAAAKKQFDRVATASGFPEAIDARNRSLSLMRYFDIVGRLGRVDSVIGTLSLLPDSVRRGPGKDSLQAMSDSLAILRAAVSQEMGEWYYGEAGDRDSSAHWLRHALALGHRHTNAPRGLYMLADLAQADSSLGLGDPAGYYRTIVAEFPSSAYTAESRRRLGMAPAADTTDPAEAEYAIAERGLEAGAYEQAAAQFGRIPVEHPASPLAARSAFAAGWVYDYHLGVADSAVRRYDLVVKRYPLTAFAIEARKRMAALATLADTVSHRSALPAVPGGRPQGVSPAPVDTSSAPPTVRKAVDE